MTGNTGVADSCGKFATGINTTCLHPKVISKKKINLYANSTT